MGNIQFTMLLIRFQFSRILFYQSVVSCKPLFEVAVYVCARATTRYSTFQFENNNLVLPELQLNKLCFSISLVDGVGVMREIFFTLMRVS